MRVASSSIILRCVNIFLLSTTLVLPGCGAKTAFNCRGDHLVSVQISDKNGFEEVVNSKEKLRHCEKTDFFSPQPYEKVLRVYNKNQEGKFLSKLTTYHNNGLIHRYLELVNGRACGQYKEWHSNGKLHIEGTVIEGRGDFSEEAQLQWVFDGTSTVWDSCGSILATIQYDNGLLNGDSIYYYTNHNIEKILPYTNGELDGDVTYFNDRGKVVGETQYANGMKHGQSYFIATDGSGSFDEIYDNGRLIDGTYRDTKENVAGRVQNGDGERVFFKHGSINLREEWHDGVVCGTVLTFDNNGQLVSSFKIINGHMNGEERVYYPEKSGEQPLRLTIHWVDDVINGLCETWYENGVKESSREMANNQNDGISTAWYMNNDIMLVEKYNSGKLISGKYWLQGKNEKPISSVSNGTGTATICNKNGFLIARVIYKDGIAVGEE